jgi:phosphonoacetaldehyde hydrolase
MAVLVAELMGVEPAHCLKVGDTVMDMQEGLAAGMRPIGVLDSGNEVGMEKDAWSALDDLEQDRMRRHASLVLTRAGAIATIKTVSGLRWFF